MWLVSQLVGWHPFSRKLIVCYGVPSSSQLWSFNLIFDVHMEQTNQLLRLKKWAGPQRSPDITPLDFFIWGYVRNVCDVKICNFDRLWQNHSSYSNSSTRHISLYLNRNRVPLGCLYSYKWCWHQTSYGMMLNFESSYTFSEKDIRVSYCI